MNIERPSGHARRAGVISLAAMVAGMLTISNFARVRGSGPQDDATLKTVSDMVVIQEGPHAGTVFVADAEVGGIFFARPSSESGATARLSFADFQPFIMGGALKRPRALAASAAKLYVGDGGENALLEVDIETRSPSVISHDRALGAPTSMAVSAEGGIAVADGSPEIVMLAPGGKMEVVKHQFNGPRRVLFSGSDLLVLDSDRQILRVEAGGGQVVEPVPLPQGLWDALADGRDFAAYRNIYYLTGAGRVVVFASKKSGAYRRFDPPLTLPLGDAAPAASRLASSRLFVTPDFLFVADTRSVWRLPRPVPVDMRFDGSAEQTSLFVAELLVYLHSQRLLASQLFTAIQSYRSVEDALREKRLLVAPLPTRGAGAVVRVRLGNLICELNREFCERNSATGERVLATPVKAAETLNLPDLAINEYVTTKRVNLAGRAVGEYVRGIFPTESERDRYAGSERLERLNPPNPKNSRPQDIFKLKEGSFVLPVKRWQMSLLAATGDLKSETSPLRRLSADYPDVYILSKEDFSNPKNSSFAPTEKFTLQGDLQENVVKNRDQLKKDINYPDFALDASRIIIGVAEDGVDFTHPDFINANGESVWFEVTPDGADVVRHPVEPAASPTPPKIGEPFIPEDHGTHVAGLLGACPEGLIPGLLSSVKGLFLIDKSNASNLQEHINAARDAGPVVIYNFSFTFCDESAALDLKQKMLDDWKESLFVVAAGNARSALPAEQDLNLSACPPVSWVESVKNMIGVGAAIPTPDGEMILMTPFIKNGITFEGSKYGKRFIQLVAPGREIYSLARGNAYKIASGTSQAVPQVTAAAAMLYSQNITDPLVLKARLIYTADWFPSLQEKVYGGALNVRRAVWEPALDLISPGDAPRQIKAVKIEGNPMVTIDGQLDEPGERGLMPSRRFQMKFRRIFRISTLASGDGVLKRVFFMDDRGKLRIITNAIITGSVKCRETREWDDAAKRFKEPEPCTQNLVLSELADYVMDVSLVPITISF